MNPRMISHSKANYLYIEILTLSFYLFFFFFFLTPTTCKNSCNPSSCLSTEPQIRFPFQLNNSHQPEECGYLGFSLFCNNNNQTSLNLPSGDVIVKSISYSEQTAMIDPQFCLPNRIYSFSLLGTPFNDYYPPQYRFFNCSSSLDTRKILYIVPFDCLSEPDFIVFALPIEYAGQVPVLNGTCYVISTIPIPAYNYKDSKQEVMLRWTYPKCWSCENLNQGTCQANPNNPYATICSSSSSPPSHSLPTRAKYGLIFGLGVPGLIFIIVILCFTNERARTRRLQQSTTNISSRPLEPLPTQRMGLDRTTIESYPKILVERLPNTHEGTCAICLSDYKTNEEVRTIPDCNHYFHVRCIDEWLSVNPTCPVCRNSPKTTP